MEAPTNAEMDAAEKKALDLVFAGMSVKELLALHERWDGDPSNGLFWAFTKRLAPLAPEEFTTPSDVGEAVAAHGE